MCPTETWAPPGWAPWVPIGGGGGGGGGNTPLWTEHGGQSPNRDGSETGPNGKNSAMKTALSSLTVYTGDITLTSATTLSQMWINGRVINHSTGSLIRSCVVAGGSTTGPLVDCTSSAAGAITIQDTLCCPSSPVSGFGTSILGGGYTAIRTEVKNTVDGFGAYNHSGQPNCNVVIQNCLSHLLYANLTDAGQKNNGVSPGPSHNDCLQYQGGNNCWVLGSTFLAFVDPTIGDGPSWNSGTASSLNNAREFGPNYQCNSCIQTNQNNGFPISSGFRIEGNFFDGGCPYSVNLSNLNGKFAVTTVDTLLNNLFDHNQGGYPGNNSFAHNDGGDLTYTVATSPGQSQILSQSNNIYWDDLVAVDVRV